MHIKGSRETEIAAALQISQPTVSRDLTELNHAAQKHLYSLAKNGIAPRYMQALDTVALVKREAFFLYDQWRRTASPGENNDNMMMNAKYMLGALKLILQCAEVDAHITSNGPAMLQLKTLDEAICTLEENYQATINAAGR